MRVMDDETDWRAVYQRYVELERSWAIPDAPEFVTRGLFREMVHGQQTESTILREFRSFRLEPPPPDVMSEAFFLRKVLHPSERKRPEGRHPDDPMEDVYAAALSMLASGYWVESPDREHLYRGHRNATWKMIPTLFREEDVKGKLYQLGKAIPRIQACVPGISEEQAIAIAQHYSRELLLRTWLIDVTYDPLIALFFASDGVDTERVGVVTCFVQNEWNKLSAGGTNRLGRLRVIDVPGVLRIENQRASFLDTSHPDLFEQYVAFSLWFTQNKGLRFEDPGATFPVTAERIYPPEDPVLAALLRTSPATTGVRDIVLAVDPRVPLGGEDYCEIAQSWCRQEGVEIDVYREDTLRVVCDVHVRLQADPHRFSLPERSLARLQDSVNLIMCAQRNGEFVTPKQALRWSLSRLPPDERVILEEIIADCARRRGLC